jgi:alkyl hydroperoxide reductase subunit AhpC
MCCFVSFTQRTRYRVKSRESSIEVAYTDRKAKRTDETQGEMSMLGKVRIGHKAPDFHCEAVIAGAITGSSFLTLLHLPSLLTCLDVSLSTFIRPNAKPSVHKVNSSWLILLFIPAAFSFVCPTEVLAFQNCLDEFKDRNCNVIFASVDSKHSLWHWQNVPRQYGGLGMIDIPLLSDVTHKLSRDYGVLVEEEGLSLRGMFIIDGEGIVQQVRRVMSGVFD